MHSMVVYLEKHSPDFHFLIAISDDSLDNIVNDFLTWVFEEVDFFEFVWLTLQSFLCFSVDLIMLVVDVVKLDETNSSYLDRVRELSKICHQSITLLD